MACLPVSLVSVLCLPALRWLVLVVALVASGMAQAQDYQAKLAIRDHKFDPAELTVPAGTKIKLLVENQDATPEEFESNELNREKIVVGKGTITVYLGPLDAGRYAFFGDFHQETAQGVLIVK
jgi:plastocyanin